MVSTSTIVRRYMDLMVAIDTPISLGVYIRLCDCEATGCFDALMSLSINPEDYNDADAFRLDYQAVSGLKKASFLPTTLDKRKAALEAFANAEKKCQETNLKFDAIMYEGAAAKLLLDDPEIFGALSRATSLISRILGPLPDGVNGRFGPGVTSVVKKDVTLPRKYASEVDATALLYRSSLRIMGPRWSQSVPAILEAEGSSITCVPKNGKTDRTICIEPHLNGYVQLGYGAAIRSRLRPWIDLNSGQEVNRFLASVAHDWRLSTIDLSSASDTISRSLIWFLLPEEWADALDTARSHYYHLDGGLHEFEKFSSMGCGFTFELESLIFYALSRACGSSRALTSTFGDDIICETCTTELLIKVLEFCGFSVNWDKSFRYSAFFESCGADFFLGLNVRPFQWKENKPSLAFKMVNDISRFARLEYGRDGRYLDVFNNILANLKKDARECLVPIGMGDIGIVVDFDEARPSVRRLPDGWCGFRTRSLKFRPETKDYSSCEGGLRSLLDQNPSVRKHWYEHLFPSDKVGISEVPVRDKGLFQVGQINVFSHWVGYGPWIVKA